MISEKRRKFLFYFVNSLTILRIVLAFIVLGLIFSGYRRQAFVIFLIGVATDLLDGDLARRFKLVSKIGETLDSLADLFLVYGAVIPLFFLNEFTLLIKIGIIIATLLVFVSVLKHTIKNKKITLPGRRPSTTINSYFVYTNLALFIINSPFKYTMAYLTFFIIAITAIDYFTNQKK